MPSTPYDLLMKPGRIYLDNAATSFPKPPEVLAAMQDHATRLGVGGGRGAYDEAMQAGEMLATCRRDINALINGEDPRHLIFTLNCTDALNIALRGLIDPFDPGHVICSALDHNSVLRPIHAMGAQWKLGFTIVDVDPKTTLLDPEEIRRALRPDTRYVVLTHVSNVTGAIQPLRAVSAICREAGVPLVVDAAQSLGHVPIDVQATGIDVLAAPGHKGLLGPLGTGLLYIRPGMETRLRPLREGGTGTRSHEPEQPNDMPDRFESGTHNAIGIAGLLAAVRWIRSRGIDRIAAHERGLCTVFLEAIRAIRGLSVQGPAGAGDRVGVVSIRLEGNDPQELSAALECGYGILTRSGIHCAPLLHKAMGTLQHGGTTRISFGPFVTPDQLGAAASALTELAASTRGVSIRK